MPEGFLKRIRERGMVVKSSAPHAVVSRKEAVGWFVTPCKWNSVLEAVAAGVALVVWLLHAEQYTNRSYLVQDMEMVIGVEQRDGHGFWGRGRSREGGERANGVGARERSWAMREKGHRGFGRV